MTSVCIVPEFGGPNLKGWNNMVQQTVCCIYTAICRNDKWTV